MTMAYIIRNRQKQEEDEREEELQDNVHFMGRSTKLQRQKQNILSTFGDPKLEQLDISVFNTKCARKSSIPNFDKDFPHKRLGTLLHNDEVHISQVELPIGRKRALLHCCNNPLPPERTDARDRTALGRESRAAWGNQEVEGSQPTTSTAATSAKSARSIPRRMIVSCRCRIQHVWGRLQHRRGVRVQHTPGAMAIGTRSLADLDHRLKDILMTKDFPEFSKYVMGQYVDNLGRHVLVFEDLRPISLKTQMSTFSRNEIAVVLKVLQPLLVSVAKLHKAKIAHRNLSPSTIFWASGKQGSGNVYCTMPCPACWPHLMNKLLVEHVPDVYFAPELWRLWARDGELTEELGLCGDVWAIGVLSCCLFLGKSPLHDAYTKIAASTDPILGSDDLFPMFEPRLASHTSVKSITSDSVGVSYEQNSILGPVRGLSSQIKSAPVNGARPPSLDLPPSRLGRSSEDVPLLPMRSHTHYLPHLDHKTLPDVKREPLTLQEVIEGALQAMATAGATDVFVQLVHSMLDCNYKRRPTVFEVMQHPLFRITEVQAQHDIALASSQRSDKFKTLARWKLIKDELSNLVQQHKVAAFLTTIKSRTSALSLVLDALDPTATIDAPPSLTGEEVGSGDHSAQLESSAALGSADNAARMSRHSLALGPMTRNSASSQTGGRRRPSMGVYQPWNGHEEGGPEDSERSHIDQPHRGTMMGGSISLSGSITGRMGEESFNAEQVLGFDARILPRGNAKSRAASRRLLQSASMKPRQSNTLTAESNSLDTRPSKEASMAHTPGNGYHLTPTGSSTSEQIAALRAPASSPTGRPSDSLQSALDDTFPEYIAVAEAQGPKFELSSNLWRTSYAAAVHKVQKKPPSKWARRTRSFLRSITMMRVHPVSEQDNTLPPSIEHGQPYNAAHGRSSTDALLARRTASSEHAMRWSDTPANDMPGSTALHRPHAQLPLLALDTAAGARIRDAAVPSPSPKLSQSPHHMVKFALERDE